MTGPQDVTRWTGTGDDYRAASHAPVNPPAGRVVAEMRKAAGVSQAELARRMGVPAQSVWRLEHGVHSPSVRTLEKIAEALGMELRVRFVRSPRKPAERAVG